MPRKSPRGGRLLWAILRLIIGFAAWLALTAVLVAIVEKFVGTSGKSNLATLIVGLFLSNGVVVVPLWVLLGWYNATTLAVALEAETGMTLTSKGMRRGEQVKHYRWRDVTGTQMVSTPTGRGHTNYALHLYTADGGDINIPRSMESFDDFLNIVNRATTHLPYTWTYVDSFGARRNRGWRKVARAQG